MTIRRFAPPFLLMLVLVLIAAPFIVLGSGGVSLPPTCVSGDMWVRYSDSSFHACVADNVWAPVRGAPAAAGYLVTVSDPALSNEQIVSPADDRTLVGDGANWQTKLLPACSDTALSKLLYNNATNNFSCGTDQTGGGGGAPAGAGYLVTAADAGLSAEVVVAPTDDNVIVGNGSTFQLKAIPNTTAGQFLTYDATANAFGAGTPAGGGSFMTEVTSGADVASTASIAFQNATGLSFAVSSGTTYHWRAQLLYTTSVATIGIRAAVIAPATTHLYYETSVAQATGTAAFFVNHQTAADSGTTSTASMSTTAGNVLIMDGVVRPSANGPLQVRFAPETATANGVVIKAGSTLVYWSN